MQIVLKAGLALALFTGVSLVSVRPAAAQHVYDASSDFSTAFNPSPLDGGVWSYGAETTLGGQFTSDTAAFTFTGNVSGAVQGWSGTDGNFPYVTDNVGGTTFTNVVGNTTLHIAPNQLDLHPGPNGEYSVLRFTAPTTSTYSFSGIFNGADSRPTTTDVHVLFDGISVADGGINVNGGGNTAALTSTFQALTKGQTLDFVVGYGNGNYGFDSTGLYAKVTDLNPVPEVSTLISFSLLLCLGLGGLLGWTARRREMQAV